MEDLEATVEGNVIRKLDKLLHEDIAALIEVEEDLDPVRMEQMYSGKNGSILLTHLTLYFLHFTDIPIFRQV